MMMRRITLAGLMYVIAIQSFARADSFAVARNFRKADATGTYYVVFKKDLKAKNDELITSVSFEIAKRKEGSSAVTDASDHFRGLSEVVANADVRVREGDLRLGHGNLDVCFPRILVSSRGLGFICFELSSQIASARSRLAAITIVAPDGTIRHRKRLSDLFSEQEIARFLSTVSLIFWCGGAWLDEEQKELIVVSASRSLDGRPVPTLFRILSLESGAVREGSSAVVLSALSGKNQQSLPTALSLASDQAIPGAHADLARLFAKTDLPGEMRMQAAIALGRLGDRRGADLLKEVAGGASSDSRNAILGVPVVLGDDAAAWLCEFARRSDPSKRNTAREAMSLVKGKAAIECLVQQVRSGRDFRDLEFSLRCLADRGPEAEAAVPDLIKLMEKDTELPSPERVERLAAKALGSIGPGAAAALPILSRLAEKYAPEERRKLFANRRQPEARTNVFGETSYSNDEFIDAIAKIQLHLPSSIDQAH